MTRRAHGGGPSYPHHYIETIGRNAGVFPVTDESVDAWCKTYCECWVNSMASPLAGTSCLESVEAAILKLHASGSEFRCALRSLEPYYVSQDLQWTRGLSGKRVTVVSSFADSIQKQIEERVFLRFGPDRMRGF